MSKPIFIAEIKTQSPYGYKSSYPFVSLMNVAIEYGDWISVHTNALWGGDFDAVSFVRRNTNKPILAKGIHAGDDDIKRAIDHGADYVLVVDRQVYNPMFKNHLLFENNNTSLIEGDRLSSPVSVYHNLKYVCNSRDLKTGKQKEVYPLESFIKAGVWTCQASGIKKLSDVHSGVSAFIVGEHLIEVCREIDVTGEKYE